MTIRNVAAWGLLLAGMAVGIWLTLDAVVGDKEIGAAQYRRFTRQAAVQPDLRGPLRAALADDRITHRELRSLPTVRNAADDISVERARLKASL